MEQRDESAMNKDSGEKSPSSQNPSETPTPTRAINNEPEAVKHQVLPDSETSSINHSGNPEIQSSSPSNHQDHLNPSSPSPPPAPPGDNDVSNPKWTSSPRSPSNSSDDDFPISSMPDPGPAVQYPPVQVMEHAEEPSTPSAYRIPSHVFDRTNTNAPEWSVASNESLFSIHMGNMSFSRELSWLNSEKNFSGPLPPLPCDTSNGGITGNQSQENKLNDVSPSDHNQSQMNKFKDMSQNVHDDYDEMTEAKAAETMRQVIMENAEDYDMSCASVASRVDGSQSHHNLIHEPSRHSDGSTKSFAFSVRPEGDKSQRSLKGLQMQEKPKQRMQAETETQKEASNSNSKPPSQPQPPKSTSNAPFKWLCCFTCCIKQ